MTSYAIASLALLKVSRDMGKDHLDTFLPMVLEAIRITNSNVVSVTDLQIVIENQFGLNIPQNAIETILHKAKRSDYLILSDGVFRPEWSKFKALTFKQEQTRALKAQEQLNRSFREYCSSRHSQTLTIEDAETAIRSLFEKDQLKMAKAISGNKILTFEEEPKPLLTPSKSRPNGSEFLAASFVYFLQETQSSDLEFLESVIKGYMLANALFLSDPAQYEREFKQTSVYFDTSFLMQLLGFNGEATKAACLELTSLLNKAGVELKCFTHTKFEIIGILESCRQRIRKDNMENVYGQAYRQTINYFIERDYGASDIDVFISQIDSKLKRYSVQIVTTPDFNKSKQHQIDEEALEQKLSDGILYTMGEAAKRDVDSVSAIMRLRKGQQPQLIEDSIATFVTTNRKLVNMVDSFFRTEQLQGVFPCITDHSLTAILWLKQPASAPELPWKRVVANCSATLQPSDQLWSKYIRSLERGVEEGELTDEEYLVARSYLVSKDILMDVTLGEETAFTKGSEQEILRLMKEQLVADKNAELQEERQKAQRLAEFREQQSEEARLNRERQSEEERLKTEKVQVELLNTKAAYEATEERRRQNIRKRAIRNARTWVIVIGSLPLVVFAVVSLVTTFYEPAQYTSNMVKILVYGFTGILAVLPIVNWLSSSFNLLTYSKIENHIRQRLEKRYTTYLDDKE